MKAMKSNNLTKRQQAVLRFVHQFLEAEGRSPTLKEIAEGVGSNAVSTIHKHIQHLIEKGFLQRSHGTGNNIISSQAGTEGEGETNVNALKSESPRDPESSLDREGRSGSDRGSVRLIPFCGDVAAGTPLIPETRALPIEVPNGIHRDRDGLFVLRVRGDSMVDDAILDGDYVVLQRRGEYRNGDRVVALLDGEEATLKEFRKDQAGVWLIPHNPDLSPRCLQPERVAIQGVLVGIMRCC